MPTYDYRCPQCDITTESFHKMCEESKVLCLECGVNMLKTIGKGIAVHFKGTGFYETDYKGK